MIQVEKSRDEHPLVRKSLQVLVLGSGNIGTDLALRMQVDKRFQVLGLIGRRKDSPGLITAHSRGVPIFDFGLEETLERVEEFDVLFDATSASDHKEHWRQLDSLNKLVIDLTPSQIGQPMVPVLMNRHDSFALRNSSPHSMNYSMVTCGAQSAAALMFSMQQSSQSILDVEVSSSIAAKSAGLATRRNVDNYISATENLAKLVSKSKQAKAILVLNPAEPPVMMRTTVTVRAKRLNLELANRHLSEVEAMMQEFIPGYRIVVPIHALESDTFAASVMVEGAGHYLPAFAGNLDVINAAAVETAFRYFNADFMKEA